MKPEFILATKARLWQADKDPVQMMPYRQSLTAFNKIPSSEVVIAQREMLEHDPSYRQIIPYVVVTHEGKILRYRRTNKVGEQRLAGKASIGWGGHIDAASDVQWQYDGSVCLHTTLDVSVRRELTEELGLLPCDYTPPQVLGFIVSDDSDVDKVHVGLLIRTECHDPEKIKVEDALSDARFMPVDQIREEQDLLESWSSYAIKKVLV